MARRPSKLKVIITMTADRELNSIWVYNVERGSQRQADTWDAFLRTKIGGLSTGYEDGKVIEDFPELRRILLKKRSQGHGHYLIYEVDPSAKTVTVLHVYHSRMDIEGRLRDEGR